MTATEGAPDAPDAPDAPAALSPLGQAVADKARAAQALIDEIDTLEDTLKLRKAALNAIKLRDLPAALADLGTTSWSGDGLEVSVRVRTAGTINKAPDLEVALTFLRENGFKSGIVSSLETTFPDAQFDTAVAVSEMLHAQFGVTVKVERSVNHMSLAAFANDRIANGLPVDHALLGLSTWREAEIKHATPKKGRR
jgi:hypothetical protein